MKTVAIINLKGGVAKTITAANMAHILAAVHGKRVLLIDNDKHGNISKMFGLHSYDKLSISDVLKYRHICAKDVICPTKYKGLDVMPSNMNLLNANNAVLLDSTRPQHDRIKNALNSVAGDYDFCIIDCAPDINISTVNALVCAGEVIIPIKIDKFAFDGLSELLAQIDNTRDGLNPGLNLRGCLITCFQKNEVNLQGEAWLRGQEELKTFSTRIRRTEKVDESTFEAMPIVEYSRRCGAAQDYLAFVREYLEGAALA